MPISSNGGLRLVNRLLKRMIPTDKFGMVRVDATHVVHKDFLTPDERRTVEIRPPLELLLTILAERGDLPGLTIFKTGQGYQVSLKRPHGLNTYRVVIEPTIIDALYECLESECFGDHS